MRFQKYYLYLQKRNGRMKIIKIWFKGDYLYGEDENGKVYRQSLLWYKNLRKASTEERENYFIGYDGIHWRNLDEDVSFESFAYEDSDLVSCSVSS